MIQSTCRNSFHFSNAYCVCPCLNRFLFRKPRFDARQANDLRAEVLALKDIVLELSGISSNVVVQKLYIYI